MDLSAVQRDALHRAQAILEEAGLSPRDLESHPPTHSSPSTSVSPLDSPPCPAILASRYTPQPARRFTNEEVQHSANHITHQLLAHAIIRHPPGAIVEYPQTGSRDGELVAHVFTIDPSNFDNPKLSFQYSLGNTHGAQSGIKCQLLSDQSSNAVVCKKVRTCCKYQTGGHNIH